MITDDIEQSQVRPDWFTYETHKATIRTPKAFKWSKPARLRRASQYDSSIVAIRITVDGADGALVWLYCTDDQGNRTDVYYTINRSHVRSFTIGAELIPARRPLYLCVMRCQDEPVARVTVEITATA